MHLNDFCCMRQGIIKNFLSSKEETLLASTIFEKDPSKKESAVLLLHGFSSTPAVYRNLLPAFLHYDGLFIPALPGHASNLIDFSQLKMAEVLSFVEKFTEKLTKEYMNVDIMGLSLGGILAYHLSAIFKLRHLYLLAPAFDLHLNSHTILKLAKLLKFLKFKSVRSAAGNLYTEDACEIAYRQLPLTTIIELLSFIQKFAFPLPSCPIDLFLGQHDAVVDSQKVADRFKNAPNTALHWLNHSAHVLPLDGDKTIIINCVKKNYRGSD